MAAHQFTIVADDIPAARPDTDPLTLHIKYKSLYPANPYIADEGKIEVSVRSLLAPYAQVQIQSMLNKHNPSNAYPEESFSIDAVVPRKTFLEKIFLLHEEFGKPDITKIRSERMSRHLYDLVSMMGTKAETEALSDHELYDHLIFHRQSYQRISWVKYETLGHKTISFIPSGEILDLYKKDYQTMREEMIYGEPPTYDQLIDRLTQLQKKFRNKQ